MQKIACLGLIMDFTFSMLQIHNHAIFYLFSCKWCRYFFILWAHISLFTVFKCFIWYYLHTCNISNSKSKINRKQLKVIKFWAWNEWLLVLVNKRNIKTKPRKGKKCFGICVCNLHFKISLCRFMVKMSLTKWLLPRHYVMK